MKICLFYLVMFFSFSAAAEEIVKIPALYTVPGELKLMRTHAQGACATKDAIYLSHRDGIFKLDRQGKFIKHISSPSHTGDICFFNGRIYAAIALPDGNGEIREYSADLEELRVKPLDFPIDGITVLNGFFYVGAGPNPAGLHRGNRLAVIPSDMSGIPQIIAIDHGEETRYGTQTMTTCGDWIFASFYGDKKRGMLSAFFDKSGNTVKTLKFNANYGFSEATEFFQSKVPIFLRVVPLYRVSRRDEDPRYRIDFYKFEKGKLTNITLPEPAKF